MLQIETRIKTPNSRSSLEEKNITFLKEEILCIQANPTLSLAAWAENCVIFPLRTMLFLFLPH